MVAALAKLHDEHLQLFPRVVVLLVLRDQKSKGRELGEIQGDVCMHAQSEAAGRPSGEDELRLSRPCL